MKQPKILILIAAAAAVILLGITSCEVLGDIISKPTARVDSVEIIGVSMNGVEITVNVEIDNPNSVGLTLDAYDYSLIVEEKNIVTGRREESVSLKANGKSILPIPIELKFGDLAAAGSSLLNDDSLPVTAALGLEVALPYVGTVRLDVSGSIEGPRNQTADSPSFGNSRGKHQAQRCVHHGTRRYKKSERIRYGRQQLDRRTLGGRTILGTNRNTSSRRGFGQKSKVCGVRHQPRLR